LNAGSLLPVDRACCVQLPDWVSVRVGVKPLVTSADPQTTSHSPTAGVKDPVVMVEVLLAPGVALATAEVTVMAIGYSCSLHAGHSVPAGGRQSAE